jgi:TIR domain-containing protein
MAARDHHTALRSEVVTRVNAGYVEIVLAKLQWGKDDAAFTLHVNPTAFTSGGLQLTDWLASLGFKRNEQCQFSNARQCWSKEVAEDFNVQDFAAAFNEGFGQLQKAEEGLKECGFWLPGSRELSPRARAYRAELAGDGHKAMSIEPMKKSEDDKFLYHFTFIKTNREKGFVTHYRPRHPPLSSEVSGVFKFLDLKQFDQCPEFEFEACHYRTLRFLEADNPFDGNVDFAHKSFDAHATRFAPAIEALLAANAAAERVGLTFLTIANPKERLREDIVRHIGLPTNPAPASKTIRTLDATLPSNFDVAISFAGSERELAEKLAEKLRAAGIIVFYDNFYPEQLWGKNLTAFLDVIYRKSAKFCVIFVSKEYKDRQWTNHELRSAQAKALELKGQEYILPVKVDDTELEGLPPNIGYVSISLGIEKIADMVIKKLRG